MFLLFTESVEVLVIKPYVADTTLHHKNNIQKQQACLTEEITILKW
jgi:hypothetical protein